MRLAQWTPRLLRRAGVVADQLLPAGPWLVQRDRGGRATGHRLTDGAWLVRSGQSPEFRTPVELTKGSWLLETGTRRRQRVVRLGKGSDTMFLIASGRRPLRHGQMHRREMALGKHLGREHIAWVQRRLGIDCVIDVGANRGQYGEKLRNAGYRGRIASFEPIARYRQVLEAKAADDPEWRVFPFALGNEDKTIEMHVSGSFSSILDSSTFGKKWNPGLRDVEHHEPEQIRVRRLEDLFEEVVAGIDQPRVYLKLDTQGFDLEAFEGAGSRTEQILGMQSEVSMVPIYEGMPRFPEQLAAYEAAGFEASGLFPVIRHVPTMRMIEFDLVMVRPEAARAGAGRS